MFDDVPQEHEYHNLGNDCYRSGRFEKAVEYYSKAVEQNPRMMETFFNRALAYARLGDYESALNDASYVIEKNATLHDAYYLRGRIWELCLNDRAALADYDKAVSLNAGFKAAAEQHRLVSSREWIFRDLRDLRDQMELEPENGYLRYQFGQRLLTIGHTDDAVRSLEQARSLGFALGDLWVELGQAYGQLKQPVQAMAAFRQSIKVNPTEVAAYAHLGQLLTECGHFRDAVGVFEKALSMPNDDLASLYCGLGTALYSIRRWDDAREAFQHALTLESRLPEAAAGMGMVAWRVGDREDAEMWVAQALEQSPSLVQAVILSVNLAVSEGALAVATDMLYRVFQQNSEDHRLAYVVWALDMYASRQPGFIAATGDEQWARRRQMREAARRMVRERVKTRSELLHAQRDLCDELLASCPIAHEAAEELYQTLITASKDVLAVLYGVLRLPALIPPAERLLGAARVAELQEQDWLADVCTAYAEMVGGTPEAPRIDGTVRILTRLKYREIAHAEGLRDLYRLCMDGTDAETVETMISLAPRFYRLAVLVNRPDSVVPEAGVFLVKFSAWLDRFERVARSTMATRGWPDIGDELSELRNRLLEDVPPPERWALASVLTNFGTIARRYVPIV